MGKRKEPLGPTTHRLNGEPVRLTPGAHRVAFLLDDLRQLANARGLILLARWPLVSGRASRRTVNLLLDTAAGQRLLDWWPGSGKWFSQARSESGVAHEPEEIVSIACRLAASCQIGRGIEKPRTADPVTAAV